MKQTIDSRFADLVDQGHRLLSELPLDNNNLGYWVLRESIPKYQAWIASTVNLLSNIALPASYYVEESRRLVSDKDLARGIPTHVVQKLCALLVSAYEEWNAGLLKRIEYVLIAATFDDFLEHAAPYHKGNKKTEAAVLASAVLEDTIKKIAEKQGIETSGKSLEQLVDALVSASVFSLVQGKRVKVYSGVRNHALHAEWDRFEIRDVGELIKGTRTLIEDFV